jgi:hypothetical protein
MHTIYAHPYWQFYVDKKVMIDIKGVVVSVPGDLAAVLLAGLEAQGHEIPTFTREVSPEKCIHCNAIFTGDNPPAGQMCEKCDSEFNEVAFVKPNDDRVDHVHHYKCSVCLSPFTLKVRLDDETVPLCEDCMCPVCGKQLIGRPKGCPEHGMPEKKTVPRLCRQCSLPIIGDCFELDGVGNGVFCPECWNKLTCVDCRQKLGLQEQEVGICVTCAELREENDQ